MIEQFIPYSEALLIKQLGFDEPCLSYYKNGEFSGILELVRNSEMFDYSTEYIAAPLYQQAFKFFREKYGLFGETRTSVVVNENRLTFSGWIMHLPKDDSIGEYAAKGETYEEAQLECLRKLIEICKSKE